MERIKLQSKIRISNMLYSEVNTREELYSHVKRECNEKSKVTQTVELSSKIEPVEVKK